MYHGWGRNCSPAEQSRTTDHLCHGPHTVPTCTIMGPPNKRLTMSDIHSDSLTWKWNMVLERPLSFTNWTFSTMWSVLNHGRLIYKCPGAGIGTKGTFTSDCQKWNDLDGFEKAYRENIAHETYIYIIYCLKLIEHTTAPYCHRRFCFGNAAWPILDLLQPDSPDRKGKTPRQTPPLSESNVQIPSISPVSCVFKPPPGCCNHSAHPPKKPETLRQRGTSGCSGGG